MWKVPSSIAILCVVRYQCFCLLSLAQGGQRCLTHPQFGQNQITQPNKPKLRSVSLTCVCVCVRSGLVLVTGWRGTTPLCSTYIMFVYVRAHSLSHTATPPPPPPHTHTHTHTHTLTLIYTNTPSHSLPLHFHSLMHTHTHTLKNVPVPAEQDCLADTRQSRLCLSHGFPKPESDSFMPPRQTHHHHLPTQSTADHMF